MPGDIGVVRHRESSSLPVVVSAWSGDVGMDSRCGFQPSRAEVILDASVILAEREQARRRPEAHLPGAWPDQGLGHGRGERPGRARRGSRSLCQRRGRPARSLGQGQVYTAQHPEWTGFAVRRAGYLRGHPSDQAGRPLPEPRPSLRALDGRLGPDQDSIFKALGYSHWEAEWLATLSGQLFPASVPRMRRMRFSSIAIRSPSLRSWMLTRSSFT